MTTHLPSQPLLDLIGNRSADTIMLHNSEDPANPKPLSHQNLINWRESGVCCPDIADLVCCALQTHPTTLWSLEEWGGAHYETCEEPAPPPPIGKQWDKEQTSEAVSIFDEIEQETAAA